MIKAIIIPAAAGIIFYLLGFTPPQNPLLKK